MKKTLLSLTLAALTAGNAAAAPQQAASTKNQAASASAPTAVKEAKPVDRPASAPASKTAPEPANQTASAAGAEARPSGALSPAAVPQIAATAFIVKDLQSNQVLAANNPDNLIEPASLTKMMTAYLTFKALEDGTLKADEMLTVSDAGWHTEGSRMFLNPHVPVSVSDLLKGMIVQSGWKISSP